MSEPASPASSAIRTAQDALRRGDRQVARRWAQQAAALSPEREEAWLILAATAGPRASVAYLKKALEINPHSTRARKGMRWAIRRVRRATPPQPRPIITPPRSPQSYTLQRQVWLPWVALLLIALAGLLVGFRSPNLSLNFFKRRSPGYCANWRHQGDPHANAYCHFHTHADLHPDSNFHPHTYTHSDAH